MRILGFEITRTKRAPMRGVDDNRGWTSIFLGGGRSESDFQRDIHVDRDAVLRQSVVFACTTLIAADVSKLRIKLVEKTDEIWQEVDSPSFSPVLRKPNRYQTRQLFIESWILSKLTHGNTYVLKERDQRGVVVGLYVLDPHLVTPLVATDGSVFYRLSRDDLSGVFGDEGHEVYAPAREIIHDRMNTLFHPLVGLSPIFACGLAAMQSLKIQQNSAKFFENMSRPSGMLTAPAQISDETAKRLQEAWDINFSGDKVGKTAVLGDGLEYKAMSVNAVDAQLVEQLKLTAEQVSAVFHVPAYMVGAAPMPAVANEQAATLRYYSQCLQSLMEAIEALLDDGLGLTSPALKRMLGTEFDLDDLLKTDTASMIDALNKAVGGGWMKINEARAKRGLPPVPGGDSPYLQQQNFSLAALAKRDASADPFASAPPAPTDAQAKTYAALERAVRTLRKRTISNSETP